MTYTYQRTYRGPLRLAVFDYAGTTVDYGCCAPAAVFIEGFRRQGVEISMAQARAPMGMEKRAHIRIIGAMPEVAAKWQAAHGRTMTEADVDAMYAEFVPLLLAVLDDYSALIPGVLETTTYLRQQQILVAGTTGYFDEALAVVVVAAERQGYKTDFNLCATQVTAGRPAPWMIYRAMEILGVYPPQAVLKIGDTVVDVEAGLNAGVWSIGVAQSGNEVGLTEAELQALDDTTRVSLTQRARQKLQAAGAHFVIDSVAELPQVVEMIQQRLSNGRQP
ncbi:MAG: phosphonoacetaldehyde hydrolase [Caldilineaceae bacterium]